MAQKKMAENQYVEFLEFLIKALVQKPEAVKVDKKLDERGVLLTLKVDREDMGMIIGKNGSTAKSIRTLIRIVGRKNNAHINLKIEEPEGSERPASQSAGEPASAQAVSPLDQVVEDLRS